MLPSKAQRRQHLLSVQQCATLLVLLFALFAQVSPSAFLTSLKFFVTTNHTRTVGISFATLNPLMLHSFRINLKLHPLSHAEDVVSRACFSNWRYSGTA